MATSLLGRRASHAMALMLAAVIALGGCTGTDDSGEPIDSGPSEPTSPDEPDGGSSLLPEAEGTTVYPVTIQTATGEITIESRPERVVMASSWDADLFAALEVTPVATDAQVDFYPWNTEVFGEIETIWEVGDEQFPAESIAVADPDLIVATQAVDPAAVAQIGDIAPVLGAPQVEVATWQDRLRLIGEALDLSTRAETFITEYETTFEQIRADHPEFGELTIDHVGFWGGEHGAALMNVAGTSSESLFTRLGFTPNPQADDTALADGLSEELLGTLEGDVLLVISQATGEGEAEEWMANPLIQGLDSVQAGRHARIDVGEGFVVTHEGEPTGFQGHLGRAFNLGPRAHLAIADLLVPILSEAVTG